MNNIIKTETINMGGDCMVDVLHLVDGSVLCVSDEYVGHYASLDSFLNDGNELNGLWFSLVAS